MSKVWDELYNKQGKKYVSRLDGVGKLADFWQEEEVKNVLDVGCGSGKHLLKLVEAGFEVTGFDVSQEAIRLAKERFKAAGERGEFKRASMYESWPYEDNSFGAVMALRSFNHGNRKQIREAIVEIKRVLKPQGWFYMSVLKIPEKQIKTDRGETTLNNLPVKMIEPRTYVPLEGKEKGQVHFIFNEQILREDFEDFKIEDLWVEYGEKQWEKYWCLLVKNRQAGEKKYSRSLSKLQQAMQESGISEDELQKAGEKIRKKLVKEKGLKVLD